MLHRVPRHPIGTAFVRCQFFTAFQTGILVIWLFVPSLGHPFFIRTSPIARCGYIARSVLSLPAVCCLSCPLSAHIGLSIAAAGGCLSLRLCAAYRYALIEGLNGSNVHACPCPLLRP